MGNVNALNFSWKNIYVALDNLVRVMVMVDV